MLGTTRRDGETQGGKEGGGKEGKKHTRHKHTIPKPTTQNILHRHPRACPRSTTPAAHQAIILRGHRRWKRRHVRYRPHFRVELELGEAKDWVAGAEGVGELVLVRVVGVRVREMGGGKLGGVRWEGVLV